MYRLYYYDRISAGLDDGGRPVAWWHRITGSSIVATKAAGCRPGAIAKHHVPLLEETMDTSQDNRRTVAVLLAALALSTAALGAREASSGAQAPFYADNDAAMVRMMGAMHVPPSGDIDRDFVEMMVPHHQGAIDMAVAYVHYGTNEQLRRLAQEIVVTQRDEIAAMRLVLGGAASQAPSPTHEEDRHAAHR